MEVEINVAEVLPNCLSPNHVDILFKMNNKVGWNTEEISEAFSNKLIQSFVTQKVL